MCDGGFMAKEWYLLKSPHGQLSGFEDDALNDFAQEGFEEILESGIAADIELCNYDLSICQPMKAIIQHNVDDTKLKTLSRELYLPIGTCKAGMYVKYKGRYWLIVGLVDDNMMYEKGIMVLCNYLLTWKNKDNRIVQRWVNITSASQYNNGETINKVYTIRSDQLLILTPDDDDCLLLTTGQRFIIDRRCSVYEKGFSNNIVCDTSKPIVTYRFTRADSVLYSYQDSGHYEFIASQDEQHKKDGYYVIDGKGYWLCEEPDNNDKKIVLSSKIEYESLEIFNGLEPSIFISKFFDAEGNEIDIEPQWKVDCAFADRLDIEYKDNFICISANDKNLINKSFELSLSANGYETVSVTVVIKAFL